ncbi:MAG: phage tail tape measure C-terminal domain-containing protein [Gallionellaceae bacterium]
MANETKIVITAATAQAEAAMGKLGNSIGGVTRQMFDLFDLSGIVGTLGGALTVTAFAGFIKSNIDAADSLESLRFQTGTAVEDLAGLKFAAEQNSVSLELVAKAGNKLGSTMADKPEIFKKLGITTKDSTGAMVQLADIFANMPEGMAKTKLAAELMGDKLGPQMVEFLSQGSASLQSYIDQGKKLLPISGESARLAKEFNDQLDRLKTSAGTAGVTLSMALLPAMNDIITQTVRAQKEYGTLFAMFAAIGLTGASALGVELNPQKRAQAELNDMLKEQLDLRKDIAILEARPGSNQPLQIEEINNLKQRLADISPRIKAQTETVNSPINEAGAAAAQARLGAEERQRLADKRAKELSDAPGSGANKGKTDPFKLENEAWVRSKEFQIAEQKRAADELDKINGDMRTSALEAQAIIFDIDPIAKASAEWEKLIALKEQGLLTDEQVAKSYAKTFGEIDKSGTDAFKSLENAVRGWGNQFTDEMTKMVRTGKLNFSSLADSIINDLLRMQIQKNITEKLLTSGTGFLGDLTEKLLTSGTGFLGDLFGGMFGAGGGGDYSSVAPGALSFAGGGFTGAGSRSGGIDGKGGFPAILHPNETVIDHTLGQGSRAPGMVVNVINQSGQNVNAKQQGGPQFNGSDWVIGVVLEAADNNPHFRNAMGMSR